MGDLGFECSTRPVLPAVREAAQTAAQALAAVEAPLLALARALEDLLADGAGELPAGDRIAHLLLALRSDVQGFATVANLSFAGTRWRLRRRMRTEMRPAQDAAPVRLDR
jgi:hypothetical protein